MAQNHCIASVSTGGCSEVNDNSILTHLLQIIVAAFGGLAKYLHEYLQGHPFSWPKALANVIVAAFAGYIAWRTTLLVWPPAATIATALGGYMGGKTMELLSEIAVSRARKANGDE